MTQKRTKIAYVIGTLDLGGAERQLVALARRLNRSRFVPLVFCLTVTGPLAAELESSGIKVKCFGLRGLWPWRDGIQAVPLLFNFFTELRREKPDIVHGFLFHAYILGTFAGKMAGVPVAVTSRRSLGNFKIGKPHYLLAERLANRMTDLIVANSEAVRQDTLHHEKIETHKVRVIYNGINSSLYEVPADSSLRASLEIPQGARVAGMIANLMHYKGHCFLLQAWSIVRRKVPHARLLLVGEGPLRGKLEGLAKDLRLEKEVLFLGSQPDLPQLLALIDVAVLPSLEEGFPNAILEAMAAGKPVVATAVGGIPEAVLHRETGLLVPAKDPQVLADALVELLRDPQRANEMGKAGRQRVKEKFDLDRMVRETEDLYEELIARRLRH